MTEQLTVEEVRALLVRAVEEKGADYVYVNPDGVTADGLTECVNYDPETLKPSCIVGHVLHYAGVDYATGKIDAGSPAYAAIREAGLDWPGEARLGLREAQNAQDSGVSWGEALAAFDRVVSES